MAKHHKRDILERRRTVPERIFFALEFTVLALWCLITAAMLVWTLISSLKTNIEYVNEPLGLPATPRWDNIKVAMSKLSHNGVGFFGMLVNSLWMTLGTSLIGTLTVLTTGYIFAQYDFRGRGLMFSIIIFVMIIPIYGNLSATYKLIYSWGLDNSPLYLITAFGGFGTNMLLTYGYYKSVPRALREAVYIDGGNDFLAYFKVYLPLGKNIFIALFLLALIGNWNNYETPILYFDKMPTLASGLYYFQQEIQYVANNPAYFMGALIVCIPVILIFTFYSNRIMGQLFSAGLKG